MKNENRIPKIYGQFFGVVTKSQLTTDYIEFVYAMFGNNDFIGKFEISSNFLYGKSKFFKFEFESNSTIVFKVVKVENLRKITH